MGYIRHDAIIVTSGDIRHLEMAREEAEELGLVCTPIASSKTNGYQSFLIVPDGSKEGWDASDAGDDMRSAWIEWVNCGGREGWGGIWVDWVHVSFGGDEPELARVVDSNE
jgi:hypothetical protein